MWTVGQKKEFGTYNANMIYDENGSTILMVYGIALNRRREELSERDAEGLAIADIVVKEHNECEALRAQLAEAFGIIEGLEKWNNDEHSQFSISDICEWASSYLAKYPNTGCVECGKSELDKDLYCLNCGRKNYVE